MTLPNTRSVPNMDGRDPQTFAILGAAIEVHRELGSGFLEPVYQEALAIEFRRREVPFAREVGFAVSYKGEPLTSAFRADFVCYDEIVVELKALVALSTREQAQLLNYLKATKLRRGFAHQLRRPACRVKTDAALNSVL